MSLNMAGFPIGTALAGVLLSWSESSAFAVAAMTAVWGAIATWVLIPGSVERLHDPAPVLDG